MKKIMGMERIYNAKVNNDPATLMYIGGIKEF